MTLHSIIIQKLLSTDSHLGWCVAAHHFKQFTYGVRNGVAIIDSDKTLICLRNACHSISLLAQRRAAFMFVNTNPLFDEIILQMTQKISCYNPNMNALWRMGGFLTNSSSPKKFRSRNKKIRFGPTKLPDCVVVLDTDRKSSVIREAAKLQVPVVGLVDSSMPWEVYSKITYPIPGNDSVQFVYLLCNMITKTFLVEQKKLGLLKDDAERVDKKRKGEEVPQIENSCKKSAIDSSKDEVLVVPYASLAPVSKDLLENSMHLEKLVVVKFNGALGTNMGFSGPNLKTVYARLQWIPTSQSSHESSALFPLLVEVKDLFLVEVEVVVEDEEAEFLVLIVAVLTTLQRSVGTSLPTNRWAFQFLSSSR